MTIALIITVEGGNFAGRYRLVRKGEVTSRDSGRRSHAAIVRRNATSSACEVEAELVLDVLAVGIRRS